MLIRKLGGHQNPLPRGRLLHDVDVDLLPSQCGHVQRAVGESGAQRLRVAFLDDHVVSTVIGRAVSAEIG